MNEQQLFIKIGDKIKEIRLEKGISQQDLAAKISLALGVRLKDLLDVE